MQYGWSIDRLDWDCIPEDVKQLYKWRSVNLTPIDERRVPASAGIYIFCSPPPGRSRIEQANDKDLFRILYNVLYVGKSTNLKSRFLSHCNNPQQRIANCRSCYPEGLEFWFLTLDENKIDYAESALIQFFGPPANRIRGITARIVSEIKLK